MKKCGEKKRYACYINGEVDVEVMKLQEIVNCVGEIDISLSQIDGMRKSEIYYDAYKSLLCGIDESICILQLIRAMMDGG